MDRPLDTSRRARRCTAPTCSRARSCSCTAELGQEELARAVAAAAYDRGAKFVDVAYFDPYVKRARIEHADPETLDFVPPWYGDRMLAHAAEHGARVTLAGVDGAERCSTASTPRSSAGPAAVPEGDPRRSSASARRTGASSRARIPRGRSSSIRTCRTTRRTSGSGSELEHVLRLDEPDPVAGVGRAHGDAERLGDAPRGAALRRDRAARARAPS